jgi:drug/metabolite transporter (DMT)-like permease
VRTQPMWWPGIPLALGSAALFGASTPFAKLLTGAVNPWLLAGLLYLGSGSGLAVVHLARKCLKMGDEAPIRRRDLAWLAAVIAAGGVAGPVLLMMGLARTSAANASLLLNLESLATMAIAWLVFKENVDRRLLLGAAAILLGAVVLSWRSGAGHIDPGGLLVAGACLCWGIDNNLTRQLSAADPVRLAMVKGLVAGSVNLMIGLSQHATLPGLPVIAGAATVGFLGYGVSLVFFVLGLRHLGTARTGAYFSLAPFIGALLAILFLREAVTLSLAMAGVLMGVGLWLHLSERHDHDHTHEELEHEHRHVHDDHHLHEHGPDDPLGEPHSHRHRHASMTHKHPHYPDLHHRHKH